MLDDMYDAPPESEEERRRREAEKMFSMKPPDQFQLSMLDAAGKNVPPMPKRLLDMLPAPAQKPEEAGVLDRMYGGAPAPGGFTAAAPGSGPATLARVAPAPQAAPAPQPPPFVPGPVKIFNDGFHGDDGISQVSPASMAPGWGQGVGAGYAVRNDDGAFESIPHALDSQYNNGLRGVGHVWTPEDFEPTSVLGVNGFKFSPDTHGYTAPSPNGPIFAAQQAAARQQGTLDQMFLHQQGEAQQQRAHEAFQAQQNELARKNALDIANVGAGTHNVPKIPEAFDPTKPESIRRADQQRLIDAKIVSPEDAAKANIDLLFQRGGQPITVKRDNFHDLAQNITDPGSIDYKQLMTALNARTGLGMDDILHRMQQIPVSQQASLPGLANLRLPSGPYPTEIARQGGYGPGRFAWDRAVINPIKMVETLFSGDKGLMTPEDLRELDILNRIYQANRPQR